MRGSQGEQGQKTGAGTGPREPAFRGGDEGAGVEETARQWTRATTWRGGHPFPQEEGAAKPAPAGPDARPRVLWEAQWLPVFLNSGVGGSGTEPAESRGGRQVQGEEAEGDT